MSGGPDDIESKAKEDWKKVRRYSGGSVKTSIPQLLEWSGWGIAILGVVFMMATLPFVGPDKLLNGGQWLGFSIVIMCLGGILGGVMRFIPI